VRLLLNKIPDVVFRMQTGPSRGGGGKEGEVFPGSTTFGAPPSLKNTENGVPDGFFMT